MLSIAVQIHRNILSAQCYIRYVGDSVNTIQVECYSSELQFVLLINAEMVKKVKISTPNDFFIPSSLSSDSVSSVKVGSTVTYRTTISPDEKSVIECSFRLQISGVDKLNHQSEPELKVDVKDFFKERFKSGAYWNLFCAICGVGLPLEPVFIERVQEYSESELSEGWFCHGNGPQPALQPSSQILYMDDTSFYLFPRPVSIISQRISAVVDEKCCTCQKDSCVCGLKTDCSDLHHSDSSGIDCSKKSSFYCSEFQNIDQSMSQSHYDTNCLKGDCISIRNFDCCNISHSDLSGANCSSKSSDFCDSKNIVLSVNQGHNSFDFSNTNHSQKHNHVTTLDLNFDDVKNQKNLDPLVLHNSVAPNRNFISLEQDKSLIRSCTHHSCGDYKHFAVDRNKCLDGSKVLNPVVECHSCRNVLTAEKPYIPFIRFYLNKLMFKNSSVNDDHLEYAHKITLLSFWSLVTKSQTSLLPSKLFLQSKIRDEELCLLLWIPSVPLAQFLFRDSLEGISPEINLKTKPVYKVLYFMGTSCSENVRSWRHDFGVDFYHVSDTMVKTLAEVLDSSSKHLAKTTNAGGFSCGFLSAPSQLLL